MEIKVDWHWFMSLSGMAIVSQVFFSLIGGILDIFMHYSFYAFLFWSTLFISGFFMCSHMFRVRGMFEKLPLFLHFERAYVIIWMIMNFIGSLISVTHWYTTAIFVYINLSAFGVDFAYKYRAYRTVSEPDSKHSDSEPEFEHPGANVEAHDV